VTEFLNSAVVDAFIAFARVAGCFLALPGFASARVPQQVRAMFVLVLTFALLPYLPVSAHGSVKTPTGALARIIFIETAVGVVIGLTVRYYMLAISFVATAASAVIGFNSPPSPSIVEGDIEPALASMISFAALLAIFAMDFHHDVIRALVLSYDLVPVGVPLSFETTSSVLVQGLSDSFLIVFRLGSPFMVYALLANLFVALLNKLTPSLPLYFVATPAVVTGGLVVAYFVLPAFLSFAGQGLQALELFR
jgi:flagellar biosynthesis protein FliR